MKPCSKCSGRGEVEVTCEDCDDTHWHDCPDCEKGKIECDACLPDHTPLIDPVRLGVACVNLRYLLPVLRFWGEALIHVSVYRESDVDRVCIVGPDGLAVICALRESDTILLRSARTDGPPPAWNLDQWQPEVPA